MTETQRTESELLVAFVRQALEQEARGDTVDIGGICGAHVHLRQAVAEILGLHAELPELQRAAQDADPLTGRLLGGRYRLQDSLGRGAMGIVYRARDDELQRAVAVKILDARLFHDEVSGQRFQREAELLAALQHPHVVAVHDRGRTPEGILFLVMELLEGASLATVLGHEDAGGDRLQVLRALQIAASESNWLRQCSRWVADLASGVEAAHALGVVHRDIKPSNVFVSRAGTAKLLDFGIAARADDGRLTATSTTLGTPWYMAPEQIAAGGGVPLPTQDVYGLCAMLYHLVTGRPPYEGCGPSVLAKLQREDPRPVRSLAPAVPRDLGAIVEKGMERAPHRRYASAGGLADDLRAFLAHQPVRARPIGRFGRLARDVRRRPARALAVAASVLALLVLAFGVPAWRRERQRQIDEAYAEEVRTLPTLLAIEGKPEERPLAVLAPEHRQGEALLSRILELRPDDLPMRMFRGALRIDLGDRDGAAADFERIAADAGSAYLAELARRYLRADPAQAGALAVDLADLPEPQSAADRYVAAFHELRNRTEGHAERAEALLRAAAPAYPPANDLLQMALLVRADTAGTSAQQRAFYEEARDLSHRLEGAYGTATARTLAVRGAALVGLRDYAAAVAPLQEALELRPERHAVLQNLGIALHRLTRLDEARECLLAARRVRPMSWNTLHTLALVATAQQDFAAAFECAAAIDPAAEPRLEWMLPDLRGTISLQQAMALRETDVEGARAAAQSAAAEFARAAAAESLASRADMRNRILLNRQLAEAVHSGDLAQAVQDYMNLSRSRANDPFVVQNLAQLLLGVDALGPQQVWMLGIWLRDLAIKLAPGNVAFQQRLRAEIQDLATKQPR